MRIEVLYFEGCPNYIATLQRLKKLLREEGLTEDISSIEVRDEASARSLKFLGSPTIRINGKDIENDVRTSAAVGLACRRYSDGLPPEDMIRAALRTSFRSPDPKGGRGAALASLAAIGSVLAASTCCLPILPFMMAAGLAGGSAFLNAARPFLLGASIVFIGYGFYQAQRAKKCQRRPGIVSSALLWASAAIVFFSIFFPQVMANAAADLLAR